LNAGRSGNVKIAIAHRNRYHPVLKTIDRFLADDHLGRLLEMRGRGKGDRRGGGEDLWVLGSHVLNLMHYFGGDPKSCSAIMLQDGRPVTSADVVDGNEGLGPLAGNELHARFESTRGVVTYFDSIANDGSGGAGFGLQLIGTKGIINLQCDRNPLAHLIPGNPFQPNDTPRPWLPMTTAGVGEPETQSELIRAVANHEAAAKDLIDAIEQDRAPLCDEQQGATTVEMICGVFESHRRRGATVPFPLNDRDHPLTKL
jgi:predicted dehydrogenase